MASAIGGSLLLLARGLQRRLNAAFWLTCTLLAAGSAASLLKAFDYEEALLLLFVLALLLASRRSFTRPTLLIDEPFSAGWITAIVIVLAGIVWVGLLSYRDVAYQSELWLRVGGPGGGGARFLRSTSVVLTLMALFSIARLMRPPRTPAPNPSEEELETAVTLARASHSVEANLVLTRDKSILLSPGRDAFLMYGGAGRSWIVMGDPVGDAEAVRELGWKFREACDRQRVWPVFYEFSPQSLPLVVELGLAIYKIGESARVRLETFSLDGGAMKQLRKTHRKLVSDGCTFEVVDSPEDLLTELRRVSDAWLTSKRAVEKRFSLGWFDDTYLRRCPIAIVRRGGEIVAFANIWPMTSREEMSIDLMRYDEATAPAGVMDFLFLELILHARREGYRWFSLGMAPLSGLEAHALGPLWNRIGAVAFARGEQFYNFQGLRRYKEKFDPQWEPRYLALPRGLALPRVLADIAQIVSGGVRGVLAR